MAGSGAIQACATASWRGGPVSVPTVFPSGGGWAARRAVAAGAGAGGGGMGNSTVGRGPAGGGAGAGVKVGARAGAGCGARWEVRVGGGEAFAYGAQFGFGAAGQGPAGGGRGVFGEVVGDQGAGEAGGAEQYQVVVLGFGGGGVRGVCVVHRRSTSPTAR